jgi:hypothetical protein
VEPDRYCSLCYCVYLNSVSRCVMRRHTGATCGASSNNNCSIRFLRLSLSLSLSLANIYKLFVPLPLHSRGSQSQWKKKNMHFIPCNKSAWLGVFGKLGGFRVEFERKLPPPPPQYGLRRYPYSSLHVIFNGHLSLNKQM